ncbi:MAG: shikimate dehydrogenase [Myxococcaceae bacterium]|nr:shikimate dehydrogenase [Myxococcaceae bacterium]MCI0671318.1 shikimate dehydrogenase [Myxococcaceae bacterium]
MSTPRRVVTLPPGLSTDEALAFAREVRARGAQLLELRTDLHENVDAAKALAGELPLLVAERSAPLPREWVEAAAVVDVPLPGRSELASGDVRAEVLVSEHFEVPLTQEQAMAAWRGVPLGVSIKHVEPLGTPDRLDALLGLQTQLIGRFGEGRVTVLVTGPCALPIRAVLARRNALDFVAASPAWAAAAGQRLLADSVRAARGAPGELRLGILGAGIAHSRSPRIHRQPFDRIDLAPDAPVEQLVDALLPHYAGFAVTSPFKKRLAQHLGEGHEAINTLWREGRIWRGANTDVEGARVCLAKLGEGPYVVLGDGGAAAALRAAGGALVRVMRSPEVGNVPLGGQLVWTWPAHAEPPEGLCFAPGARVAVIAYGPPGRRIAERITERGGRPLKLGAAWFSAQARAQRAYWGRAT